MSLPTNFSTIMFLFNPSLRAIGCNYDPNEKVKSPEGQDVPKTRMFKTLDPTIKKGDYVVIPTTERHKMTVVRVETTDLTVDIESNDKVDWIIGKVDRKAYEDTLSREGDAIAKIRQAEAAKKRDDIVANLTKHYGDALGSLANVSGPAIEHKPTGGS